MSRKKKMKLLFERTKAYESTATDWYIYTATSQGKLLVAKLLVLMTRAVR